jgi:hypothetical protein
MPQWAQDAMQPGAVSLLDLVLELCSALPAYTVDAVLDMPVRRFWRILDWLRRRNDERAALAKENPLAALALMNGR